MSFLDKAKGIVGALVGKGKDLVGGVMNKIGGHGEQTSDTTTSPTKATNTIPSDGEITPAHVAEAVKDPDLPHPEPPPEALAVETPPS